MLGSRASLQECIPWLPMLLHCKSHAKSFISRSLISTKMRIRRGLWLSPSEEAHCRMQTRCDSCFDPYMQPICKWIPGMQLPPWKALGCATPGDCQLRPWSFGLHWAVVVLFQQYRWSGPYSYRTLKHCYSPYSLAELQVPESPMKKDSLLTTLETVALWGFPNNSQHL